MRPAASSENPWRFKICGDLTAGKRGQLTWGDWGMAEVADRLAFTVVEDAELAPGRWRVGVNGRPVGPALTERSAFLVAAWLKASRWTLAVEFAHDDRNRLNEEALDAQLAELLGTKGGA
jgi:hypothetical protein